MDAISDNSSPNYAVSFESRLLGGKCNIEVVVELKTGQTRSILSMPSLLSATPVFSITLQELRRFAQGVQQLKAHARVLASLPTGATQSQLKCFAGQCSAVAFQPEGKPARFTLNIGAYHSSGELKALDLTEIEDAIKKMESLEGLARAASGT